MEGRSDLGEERKDDNRKGWKEGEKKAVKRIRTKNQAKRQRIKESNR